MLTGMHNALGKGQGMGLSPLLPPPRKREDKPPQGARQWVVLPFRFASLAFVQGAGRWLAFSYRPLFAAFPLR